MHTRKVDDLPSRHQNSIYAGVTRKSSPVPADYFAIEQKSLLGKNADSALKLGRKTPGMLWRR